MPGVREDAEVGEKRPLDDDAIAESKDGFIEANPDGETDNEEGNEHERIEQPIVFDYTKTPESLSPALFLVVHSQLNLPCRDSSPRTTLMALIEAIMMSP